ncbi:MAG TPA: copper amine oxidase N-terminal domain-containing protein, partial [Caldisericia bacterium]|nr:copper amine oxidase N-terminal domain-containing protein [Caldisericia bacterium]
QAGNITEWKKTVNYVAQEIIKITMWVGSPRAQVNGQTIYLDTPAVVKNGRTFVPVRFVSEKMKASVIWNQKTRSVTVEGKTHKCIVSIGSDTAFLDGDVVRLEAAPFIQGSSTMVPLRFIAQDTLGATISYDPKDKRIDLELVIEL